MMYVTFRPSPGEWIQSSAIRGQPALCFAKRMKIPM